MFQSRPSPSKFVWVRANGVSEVIAREALRLGAMKLPVMTRVVAKEDW
jgi:large subunit ribosomal protein L16